MWKRVGPTLIIRLRNAASQKRPGTGERRWNPLCLNHIFQEFWPDIRREVFSPEIARLLNQDKLL